MSRRGTTPTHTFNVDVDLRQCEVVYLTYRQGNVSLDKPKEELVITADKIEVYLSQKDTLKFKPKEVQAQIRARFPDGTAIASNIMTLDMDAILKEGVI